MTHQSEYFQDDRQPDPEPESCPADDNPAYLIWSHEHSAWWGPARRGYVREFKKAGRYSQRQAFQICRDAFYSGLRLGQFAELPVRVEDMQAVIAGLVLPEWALP